MAASSCLPTPPSAMGGQPDLPVATPATRSELQIRVSRYLLDSQSAKALTSHPSTTSFTTASGPSQFVVGPSTKSEVEFLAPATRAFTVMDSSSRDGVMGSLGQAPLDADLPLESLTVSARC